jgi:signal transduction histidine kinase
MTPMYSQSGEPLASEVTEALNDLAALARRASWAPYEHLDSVASDLLACLLSLCKAERGAVLLHEDHLRFQLSGSASAAPARAKAFRALALHHLPEEEVNALLTPLPAADVPAQAPAMTRWLVYRLFLGNERADDAQKRPEMLADTPFDPADRAQHALLVIGWEDQHDQEHACATLLSQCSVLLHLVANAVGAVITSILLKERVYELERKSVREALEGMELLKAELLGTVSHELRGPLASIKGYAATLLRHERRLAREERHQFLLAINEASDRLEVIIERLLEVSQLETGKVSLERSPVDMARLASEAIAVIEERVAASLPGRFDFTLQLENADGTPGQSVPLMLADPRRLRQVLDNLLENARNYSPEGGLVTVTIRPVVQVSPGAIAGNASQTRQEYGPIRAYVARNMLELCISDHGQGIPAEHLERIFDRFHRVDTRLTRETSGLGLGLTICKRIIELHDGTIWAENRPDGKGSAFYVRLPLDETVVLS